MIAFVLERSFDTHKGSTGSSIAIFIAVWKKIVCPIWSQQRQIEVTDLELSRSYDFGGGGAALSQQNLSAQGQVSP